MSLLARDSKGVAGERLEFSGLAYTADLQGVVVARQVFGPQSQKRNWLDPDRSGLTLLRANISDPSSSCSTTR